ncbi:MAG: ThiF family adenylyltransferase [Humidesulfovibrio sp.]|uniref:HesA/MoeB/ThiF family protein n=1 Tax=Humidesulfovibrio sp. TaxID=2910988 RepID=UPI00273604F4|nr:ThiF family adenylyltransferase [Humidesulfovibrio sp.]MDP2846813.1 ThiF family adenylyltransferase [Humidesulfovibrio sp.]
MNRLGRQSFLGPDSESLLRECTVGLVGLGGGGAHVVQQFAHLGVGGFVLVDPDKIDLTNTNRLVGGTLADAEAETLKVAIAERVIRGVQPDARVVAVPDTWLAAMDDLKVCDVIVGAVDSYKERDQLERFARRHLIPYLDIGMDVHALGKNGFLISGQVIMSMPGGPCLRCCGLVTEERLTKEAQAYGAAGGRPQVVWPNGVLASTAVGLLAQLIAPWHHKLSEFVYLEYDGNKGTMKPSARMELLQGKPCPHHPAGEVGDLLFDIREHIAKLQTDHPGKSTESSLLINGNSLWAKLKIKIFSVFKWLCAEKVC